MANLMRASRQWAQRPADERFWSVDELAEHLRPVRRSSVEKVVQLKDLAVEPDGNDLRVVGPQGTPVSVTNWSFGQLCRSLEAPPEYLSRLPSELACKCLNQGLQGREEKVKLLLSRQGDEIVSRAFTGPKYSRIWDLAMLDNLRPALEAGWRTPPARPNGTDPRSRPATKADIIEQEGFWGAVKEGQLIAPSGVYRGDRDSFIFLVNPERTIDDGSGNGGLMRGIFVSNSEVGGKSFRVDSFLFENVCSNHIVWGASRFQTLRLIHRGEANTKFGSELRFRLRQYNDEGLLQTEKLITAAKAYAIAKDFDGVITTLFGMKNLNVSKSYLEQSWKMAVEWEHTAGSPPNTAWGFAHGMTRFSQTLGFTDARTNLDLVAGKILQLAV